MYYKVCCRLKPSHKFTAYFIDTKRLTDRATCCNKAKKNHLTLYKMYSF